MDNSAMAGLDSLLRHSIALHDSAVTLMSEGALRPAPGAPAWPESQLVAALAGAVVGAVIATGSQAIASLLASWKAKKRARARLLHEIVVTVQRCGSCAALLREFPHVGSAALSPLKSQVAAFEGVRDDLLWFRDEAVRYLLPHWVGSLGHINSASDAMFAKREAADLKGVTAPAGFDEAVTGVADGLIGAARRGRRLYTVVFAADRMATRRWVRRWGRGCRRIRGRMQR
jgi:hypothetical protein